MLTEQEEIRTKLKWLMFLRVVVVTVLLGASIVFVVGKSQIGKSAQPFLVLIAATYCLTIFYSFLLPRLKRVVLFAFIQIAFDLFLETYLVFLTGVIESPFSPFYMITIISASIILGRRGGILTASMASIFFGTLVDFQYFLILPALGESTTTGQETLYLLFLNIVAFLAVAYLGGGLAQKLSSTQKRLQKETTGLAELKVFHGWVVESMSGGLLTTDMAGGITSFNRAAEEITGRRFQEVSGKPWWKIFAADNLKEIIDPDKPLREPIRFDFFSQRKDGSSLTLGMTVSAFRNQEGRQIGGVWIFQDLTRIREMEEEIQHKKRLATLGEMAAGMAHEIRNPLAALSGSIQMLRTGLQARDEDVRRLIDIALKETNRLNGIITEFLLYARPAPMKKKRSDINLLLSETMDLVRTGRDSVENIHVHLNLTPGELWASIDPDQIRQVFWNLAINAFDALDKDGELIITTRLLPPYSSGEPSMGWVEITFTDDGRGVPKEDIGRIFYPFYSTKQNGSGLGLSVVHRIVEAHQGRIRVESEVDQGAKFSLAFPIEYNLPSGSSEGQRSDILWKKS